jgi:hypothetical protein
VAHDSYSQEEVILPIFVAVDVIGTWRLETTISKGELLRACISINIGFRAL